MSKINDTAKLGPAMQARELQDNELQQVSGGWTFENVMVESIKLSAPGPAINWTQITIS